MERGSVSASLDNQRSVEAAPKSVPGPPAVTIPRVSVVAGSDIRTVEIGVAINPAGDGPSPIRPIAIARLVANDLRGCDQRIRNGLAMAEKGRRIGVGGNQKAGNHSIVWNGKDNNGRNAGSGVYFYKMTAGKFTSSKKMIMMK